MVKLGASRLYEIVDRDELSLVQLGHELSVVEGQRVSPLLLRELSLVHLVDGYDYNSLF